MRESKLINIPIGSPLWAEPLMKNLYTLESMIEYGSEGGDVEGLDEIESQLSEIVEQHKADIERLSSYIDRVTKTVFGQGGQPGLIHTTKINTEAIKEIKQTIENMEQGGNVSDEVMGIILKIQEDVGFLKDITDELSSLQEVQSTEISQVKSMLEDTVLEMGSAMEMVLQLKALVDNSTETIEKLQEQTDVNTEDIDTLERRVGLVELSASKNHHIVNTTQEMQIITQKGEGSLCFVRSEMQLFIWDGKWTPITSDHAIGKVQWKDIIDAPASQPDAIDSSVSLMHTHGNKTALDSITFSAINEWDSKADSSDIPTRVGQLENDSMFVTKDDVTSQHTQREEPDNMSVGDEWHKIID